MTGVLYWSGSFGWDVSWCLVRQLIRLLNDLWWLWPINAVLIIIVWYNVGAHSWSGYAGHVGGGGH